MRKQRNMPQIKQEKTPENKLNEMEVSNLPESEFKIIVIRMLNELMRRIGQQNESIKRDKKGIT